MRKMIAAMKVSLDQKFQGPNDYADWVAGWSDDYDLGSRIDACLLGGRMYRGYEQYWSAMRDNPEGPSPMTSALPTEGELAWSARIPHLPHYVLSKTLTVAAWPNTRFLRDIAEVAALKAEPGRDLYLMGGGQAARLLMEAGLVDEFRLITYPVIAGGPHSLFGSQDLRRSAELIASHRLPDGLVRSDYSLRAGVAR